MAERNDSPSEHLPETEQIERLLDELMAGGGNGAGPGPTPVEASLPEWDFAEPPAPPERQPPAPPPADEAEQWPPPPGSETDMAPPPPEPEPGMKPLPTPPVSPSTRTAVAVPTPVARWDEGADAPTGPALARGPSLADLAGWDFGTGRSGPARNGAEEKQSTPNPPPRPAAVLDAALPLGQFLAGLNWRNEPVADGAAVAPEGGPDGEVADAPAPIPGAAPLGVFLAGVNWRNGERTPDRTGPTTGRPRVLTLDAMLAEFVW